MSISYDKIKEIEYCAMQCNKALQTYDKYRDLMHSFLDDLDIDPYVFEDRMDDSRNSLKPNFREQLGYNLDNIPDILSKIEKEEERYL